MREKGCQRQNRNFQTLWAYQHRSGKCNLRRFVNQQDSKVVFLARNQYCSVCVFDKTRSSGSSVKDTAVYFPSVIVGSHGRKLAKECERYEGNVEDMARFPA